MPEFRPGASLLPIAICFFTSMPLLFSGAILLS